MDKYLNVLLINLHNRPDRLIHSLNELKKIGLSKEVTRIEACNVPKAKQKISEYISITAYQNIIDTKSTCILPNYSSVGCAISHINCWKYIVKNNIQNCIIAEDDNEIVNPNSFKFELNYI